MESLVSLQSLLKVPSKKALEASSKVPQFSYRIAYDTLMCRYETAH